MAYTYDHPRPAVTVDNLIFSFEEKNVQVLLVQRRLPPFKGEWALPGGFVEINESLDDAALRELREETGIDNAYIQQLRSFGEVDRDPRGRIISVAYFALVRKETLKIKPGSDAQGVAWFNVNELPILAFDHDEIIDYAVEYLRDLFKYKPISFELLPDKFTLTEMQRLYEAITSREMDKRNFRKKIMNMDILREFEGESDRVVKRMATLYTFDRNKYRKLTEEERDKITFY